MTLSAFVAAAVLAGAFLWLQARRDQPMLLHGLFGDRNRSGSYATMLFTGAGLMGTFYLLALYLQQVQQFGPIKTGMASLPFSVGIVLGAGISSKLVERRAPRAVAVPGLLLAAVGMYWLSMLAPASSCVAHIMPAVLLTSFGLGMAAVTMTLTAVHRVADERAGVGSALVNMAQQLDAALGLAVFTTVSVSTARDQLPDVARALQDGLKGADAGLLKQTSQALTQGYTTAFLVGAGMLQVAAVIAGAAINMRRTQRAVPSGAS